MVIHIFNRGNKKIKRLPLYTFMQTIVVSVKVSHADMALLENKEHGYVFLFIFLYIYWKISYTNSDPTELYLLGNRSKYSESFWHCFTSSCAVSTIGKV